MNEKLVEYICFYVTKLSHHGTLALYRNRVEFVSTSENEPSVVLKLSNIKSVNVEKRLVGAVNNLEVRTEDETFLFSGLHESEAVKDYITLLQSQQEKASDCFGFTAEENEEEMVRYKPLANPTILVNQIVPTPFSNFRSILENPQSYIDLYTSLGNEDVKISPWESSPGCLERTIDYMKLVVVPVIGKNLIHVIEYQKLFEIDGGIAITVASNLGKTPYADCFDPYVQIIAVEKDDQAEVTIMLEIIWKSEPFVKGIVESQTSTQIKEQYSKFLKDICKSLGADDGDNKEEEAEQNAGEDKFLKAKRIYKICIILLLFVFIAAFLWKCWPKGGVHYSARMLFQLFVFAFFILFLVIM